MKPKRRADRLAAILFFLSYSALIAGGALVYGIFAGMKHWAPVPQLDAIYEQVKELLPSANDFLIVDRIKHDTTIETLDAAALAPGLVLVAGDYEPRQTFVRIMERDGTIVHEWRIPWGDIWASGEGEFPTGRRPASNMYLHGFDLLPDGSIVSNFEHLSTFRMDVCGKVVWKHDNLGHHSAHYDGSDSIWVSAEDYFAKNPTGIPNHDAPFRSWTLQQIALDGEILRTIPVVDIILQNNLDGLLYASNLENARVRVSGDTLHLNDVESFPFDMTPGFFKPGDLAISLRNIHTVMVLDGETLKVKLVSTGEVLRQHDIDFLDGNTVSIFDNRHPPQVFAERGSQIVEIDGPTGETRVALSGKLGGEGEPFFTHVMGAHQRLSNGNILIAESDAGRALEFTAAGDLVWRYSNRWAKDETKNLRVFGVDVLPPEMDAEFFKEKKALCGNS